MVETRNATYGTELPAVNTSCNSPTSFPRAREKALGTRLAIHMMELPGVDTSYMTVDGSKSR